MDFNIKKLEYDWSNENFGQLERIFFIKNIEPFEVVREYHPKLGNGFLRRILIRKGFEIWISESHYFSKIINEHNEVPAKLIFSYILSGEYITRLDSYKKSEKKCAKGQAAAWFNPSGTSYDIIMEPLDVHYLAIMIDPALFDLKENINLFPAPIRDRLNGNIKDLFFNLCSITPAMQLSIDQILNCQYTGIMRKMFMEAKALELMTLQLEIIDSRESSAKKKSNLIHPIDIKGTEYVQKILTRKMDSPPNLEELARSVGMSSSKLNRCFRKKYGMTVFQYLRYTRMETARELIIRRGISVTEASGLVGYNSLSHFSQAYKKQFGVSPRENLYEFI